MCIYCIYTLYTSLSLGQTTSFFFFFPLPYDEFVLKGIFFVNKGFDASSFLCEMGSSVPWGKLHRENQSSCDPLCVCAFKSLLYKLTFADHVCNLLVVSWSLVDATLGLLKAKSCLLRSSLLMSAWARAQQNQNGWTDFLCSVNTSRLFCVCLTWERRISLKWSFVGADSEFFV